MDPGLSRSQYICSFGLGVRYRQLLSRGVAEKQRRIVRTSFNDDLGHVPVASVVYLDA